MRAFVKPYLLLNGLLWISVKLFSKSQGASCNLLTRNSTFWVKPAEGWVKLNTDGSFFLDKSSAAAGGIVRHSRGNWLFGFSCNLHNVSITTAELLGLYMGLSLAWEKWFVVKLLKEKDISSHPLGHVVRDCQNFLHLPCTVKVVHTLRVGNKCADALAKLGHAGADLLILDEPPEDLLQLLREEAAFTA